MNIIIAVLIFGIIIIVHELGHFLVAKKNGIQVDEFCIGLGPTVIGKQIGDTFYSIHLLPFGGRMYDGRRWRIVRNRMPLTTNPYGPEWR